MQFFAAIDNIVAPKIELAIRSINASSGRDVTSVTANSDCGERIGINLKTHLLKTQLKTTTYYVYQM